MVTEKIIIMGSFHCIFETSDYVFPFWGMSWIACFRSSKMGRITNLPLTQLTYFYHNGHFLKSPVWWWLHFILHILLWSSQDFFSCNFLKHSLKAWIVYLTPVYRTFGRIFLWMLEGVCSLPCCNVFCLIWLKYPDILSSTFLRKGICGCCELVSPAAAI